MITFFGIAAAIAYVMYAFHHSDVVEEYLDLLSPHHQTNLLYFREYKDYVKANANPDDWQLSYRDYLIRRRNTFFIRLIYCPLCLSFWLSVVCCAVARNLLAIL